MAESLAWNSLQFVGLTLLEILLPILASLFHFRFQICATFLMQELFPNRHEPNHNINKTLIIFPTLESSASVSIHAGLIFLFFLVTGATSSSLSSNNLS